MFQQWKLLESLDLLCQAALMLDDLDTETEPLSYTEPINKIAIAIDEMAEGISELLEVMDKEA